MRLPQVRDFEKLRRLLELVQSGVDDPATAGTQMGAGPNHPERHAGYYREAAEILGLMQMQSWQLTERGERFLISEAHSPLERAVLHEAVREANDLGPLVSALLEDGDPDVEALVAHAMRALPDYSRGTIERRISDTLSWRGRLTGRAMPKVNRYVLTPEDVHSQTSLFDPPRPIIESREWPDPTRIPFNWPKDHVRVERVVFDDLRRSDNVLLVLGYASLQHLSGFVASLEVDRPRRVRIVFGNEPFVGREPPSVRTNDTLSQDVLDYWLERGVSICHARAVLAMMEAMRSGRVETRIARRSPGLHAKMFVGDDSVTIGSSNFTYPGLIGQLEANVRLGPGKADKPRMDESRRLAEIYWRLALPFDEALLTLLESLLRRVTWQEALARGCAELLEGEWARMHLVDELGYHQRLWPSQLQGIGQALYVLMEVGSVLIADATGSGKTRTGAWLLRSLRERLVTMGRPIADPVLISPPAVTEAWLDELHEAEVRVQAHSHGALSNGRAAGHDRIVTDVEGARLLALDEAHNFIQASNRSTFVTTNLADHVILFTATPINRDASDLLGIVDLLGADNLDDETLEILVDAGWRHRRPLDEVDRTRLRRAVARFTVRRTKVMFNALIDAEPDRYHNAQGQPCRYPVHDPKYYALNESKRDRELAAEIGKAARMLRGILWLADKPIQLTRLLEEQGWTAEKYVQMRLRSACALARYHVRAALRSSGAALHEHLRGTKASSERYGLHTLEKDETGAVIHKLERLRDRGPQESPLGDLLPEWLRDHERFREVCGEEIDQYENIVRLCERLSSGRERAKARLIRKLVEKHHLVVAFDSRPITLNLLHDMLKDEIGTLLATGSRRSEQKAVQRAFELSGSVPATPTVALCSNAMSEGVNLQRASAIIHLDMPSVVRIAEQRVGRVDRMDSPHGRIESWWPRDAPEFALASDEKLGARLDLVDDVLGANVSLPVDDADTAKVIKPEQLIREMAEQAARQIELLDDAFAPVRMLVEGPRALVSADTYGKISKSQARVLSAVAVVRARENWGFFVFPGTARSAPRWALVDASGQVRTVLDDVAAELRQRLEGADDIPLDGHAVEVMDALIGQLRRASVSLLPRRKQRAFEQMSELVELWAKQARRERDSERLGVLETLLGLCRAFDEVDLDELVDAWLASIRPEWRKLLRDDSKRRRNNLRRLAGLTVRLRKHPLSTETLTKLARKVRRAKPLGERVVAAIVGVA